MTDPILRRALPSDWNAIRELLLANKLPLAGAQDHLGAFRVLHDGSGLLACGGLEIYGTVALLRSVAVVETHRGRRLGHALVAQLQADALDGKAAMLVLLTETAQDFFRRLGFRIVPRSELPPAILSSAEFRGACPASAIAMARVAGVDTN